MKLLRHTRHNTNSLVTTENLLWNKLSGDKEVARMVELPFSRYHREFWPILWNKLSGDKEVARMVELPFFSRQMNLNLVGFNSGCLVWYIG